MPRGNDEELSGLGGATIVTTESGDNIEMPAISAMDYLDHNLAESGVDEVTLAWYEEARARYGDIVQLRNGERLIVGDTVGDHPVGRYSVNGLDQLKQFRKDIKTGDVICDFYDGATASVDADCSRAACDCGASFCSHRVAAIYVAIALMSDEDLPPAVGEHKDAFKNFLAEQDNPEKLTAAAGYGAKALSELGVHVKCLDPADREPIELPNSGFAKNNPDLVRRRIRSARRTGMKLYSNDELHYRMDDTLLNIVNGFGDAMKSNPKGSGFTACLYGPPSTGKSFSARVLSASRHMPLMEVNFGQNADLEMYIGTQAIEDGDTTVHLGPIGKAATADGGSIVVINEAVNIHPDQMSFLHDMIGSGIPGEERFITINAPSGGEEVVRLPVHPDTVFILTYNPGPQGRHLPEAVESRCMMMEVPALNEEEEKERLATQIYASLASRMTKKDDDDDGLSPWSYDPTKTKKETINGKEEVVPVGICEQIQELEDECSRAVAAFGKLRSTYNQGDLQSFPDSRTMQRFVRAIILGKRTKMKGVAPEDRPKRAAESAVKLIQHLGYLDDLPNKRREDIIQLIKSEYNELGPSRG